MFPTIEFGPWRIHSYSALYLLAVLIAGVYGFHRLRRLDSPSHIVERGLILTILGGFAGALLIRSVPTFRDFILTGNLTWVEGSSFIGGLLGGIVAAWSYCRWNSISIGQAFDLGGGGIPLGQAIGRIGCYAAGCCYGRATDSWLGVYLRDEGGTWMVRYPTQLMSAAIDLFIFVGFVVLERYGRRRMGKTMTGEESAVPSPSKTWPFDGFLFLTYLGLYCIKRFMMEFLRGDAAPVFGSISWVHIYSVGGTIIVAALILSNLHRSVVVPSIRQQRKLDSLPTKHC